MVLVIFYPHGETTASVGKAFATDGTNARRAVIFRFDS